MKVSSINLWIKFKAYFFEIILRDKFLLSHLTLIQDVENEIRIKNSYFWVFESKKDVKILARKYPKRRAVSGYTISDKKLKIFFTNGEKFIKIPDFAILLWRKI